MKITAVVGTFIGYCRQRGSTRTKTWLAMKLTAVLLTACCLQLHAAGHSQNVSLSLKEAPLEHAFKQIQHQTGYYFIYEVSALQKAHTITVEVKDATLKEALDLCLKDQPFAYIIV